METDLGDQDRRRGLGWILECDGARGRVGLWGVESGRRGEEKVGCDVSFGNVGRLPEQPMADSTYSALFQPFLSAPFSNYLFSAAIARERMSVLLVPDPTGIS
jgi:hypothetical protein